MLGQCGEKPKTARHHTRTAHPHICEELEEIYMHLSTIGIVVPLAFLLLLTPLCSDAQQPGKVYRIAFLEAGSPRPPSAPTPILDAFRQRLQEAGLD